ncbi:endonuclease/exonuclease/phosphatase family protein [Clostridium celatum]|uniref:Endonuclease/exonuclease/phosphatase family protein n=1 Tax=Clostridium celatum DSM 1785 TaxID=545697 RepID=L1QEQ1_9CLOT|nr:endonuclease/exonuclease/phosphatase family protein [Clostridium celatum]EKY26067.1 endonuclease/exonuclease/phosphatase family protein [Clostridium celatum DSM 1785]MCE9656118.1 endonuclease/exonuclease/phosphatase family protein [Clostridium celatum]MDY3359408.1 endonuclease/exonuclease/phosphatase family protein [Clostridium celatum]
MKLLTLNCHSWQEENQLEKIKYLAQIIKKNQYDVIALQEVSQSIKAKITEGIIKEDNFAKLLLEELKSIDEEKYSFIWDYSHIGYDIYEEGLCIFTKHEIKEYKSFYISKSNEKSNYKSRNIIKATININGEDIDFYSCHTGWWNDELEPFRYQADKLIENLNNKNVSFIMGDFNNNALVKNEGYDYLINKGIIDTYTTAESRDDGITVSGEIAGWEDQKEKKRLDLILTNTNVNIVSSKVIFNGKNKKIISDHYGVEVVVGKIY